MVVAPDEELGRVMVRCQPGLLSPNCFSLFSFLFLAVYFYSLSFYYPLWEARLRLGSTLRAWVRGCEGAKIPTNDDRYCNNNVFNNDPSGFCFCFHL